MATCLPKFVRVSFTVHEKQLGSFGDLATNEESVARSGPRQASQMCNWRNRHAADFLVGKKQYVEVCFQRLEQLWVIKTIAASFTLLPTSGNDGEDRLAAVWTRFGFARENGFRLLVR